MIKLHVRDITWAHVAEDLIHTVILEGIDQLILERKRDGGTSRHKILNKIKL